MRWWERLRNFDSSAVDYPGTNCFIESPHTLGSGVRNIDFIVIHTTGRDDISGAINEFLAHSNRKSSHYIVDRDGTIIQMVRENYIAGHCGNLDNRHNAVSIGIEHVASFRSEVTLVQYQKSAELVRWLCTKYSIPTEHNPTRFARGIRGHREQLPNDEPPCPNRHWDWQWYIDRVNGRSFI